MAQQPTLLERLAALNPPELLPARLSQEGASLPSTLKVAAVESLGTDMWLALLSDGNDAFACPLVDDEGALRRARPGDGAAAALINRLTVAPDPAAAFDWKPLRAATATATATGDERAMGVDQTHESIVVADTAVVKWMVRAEPSPAPDLISHLAMNGFKEMPRPWGFVTTSRDGGVPVVLASVTDFLPHAVDGWSWLVDDVANYGLNEDNHPDPLGPIVEVARIVAQMHAALSRPSEIIAKPMGLASSADIAVWQTSAVELLTQATAEVGGDEGNRLRSRAQRIAAALDTLGEIESTPTIPIHGDLHVGQILRWDGGYAVNDFDGNPVVPAGERLRAQPAARDVAGMLQSIDHVARVVIKRREGVDVPRVLNWIHQAQTVFMAAYSGAVGNRRLSAPLGRPVAVTVPSRAGAARVPLRRAAPAPMALRTRWRAARPVPVTCCGGGSAPVPAGLGTQA